MPFDVQQLRTGDWQRVRKIRLRALAETPDAFGAVFATEEKSPDQVWQNRLKSEVAATFVATSNNGDDIGLITTAPYDEQVGLYSMWVAPEARKQGVAGLLVDAVITWATSHGFKKLLLDVGDDNRAAIALYASKGFTPTGVTGTLPPPREQIHEHQQVLRLRS
ncbi:MAG: GNAT superfamily N-acetyltransferase [Akkermansiaceae bacterium]|jgi:GNAT superfamily N-acetyltransferase